MASNGTALHIARTTHVSVLLCVSRSLSVLRLIGEYFTSERKNVTKRMTGAARPSRIDVGCIASGAAITEHAYVMGDVGTGAGLGVTCGSGAP